MKSRNRKIRYRRVSYRNNNNNLLKAIANIKGSIAYPSIMGNAKFYEKGNGVLIKLEIKGLPNKEKNNFFGFHIHEFGICNSKNEKDSFLDAGAHFDLEKDKHPNHTGDLPSIYSNDGYAYIEFYTNRFTVNDVIGKSVIIHEKKDDFMTEPSGNSGSRIACGVIQKM